MADAATVDDVEKLKRTPAYAQIKTRYQDREWRLDNIYRIINEKGESIRFMRNAAQRAYMRAMWSRDLIPKARQLGFSTLIELLICDTCVFRSNITAGIVDATLDDAVDKLSKIRFAYDGLDENIRTANPLVKRNEKELRWANGSNVSVGTSWRGGTAQILHSSELGRVSMEKPDAAREFRVGSLPAVHESGWAVLESTAHGTAGEFHDFVRAAEKAQQEKRPLSPLEFKLHFYGWWMKQEYRQPNNLVVLTQELRDYFTDLNPKLRALGHPPVDADQMAWYAIKYAEFGPDDMRQEYPSCISGDTLVATPRGLMLMRDVEPDGMVILAKYNKGIKPAFQLTTDDGYRLVGTADHPILCADGAFREVDKLKVGDEIALQSAATFPEELQKVSYRPMPFVDAEITIDERMALFIGIYMGDGSFYKNGLSIACDAQDQDLVEIVKELFREFVGEPHVRLSGTKLGCSEVRISRKGLVDPFTALGIVRWNSSGRGLIKRNICVPYFIKRSPRNVVAAFLRGLFEADGFALRNGCGVKFFGKGQDFVCDIQVLLLQFGITSMMRKVTKTIGTKSHSGYSLSLRKMEARKFAAEIGFLSRRKLGRVTAVMAKTEKGRKIAARHELPITFAARISSIDPVGAVDVYDITTNTGRFSAGGIVVHNCMSELFFNSMQGAYWRRELNKARAEQRIGLPLPHDASRKVNTWWDIGEDGTAIIFHQSDGVRHRFIDYYEEQGSSIQRCAGVLDEKRRERGFLYGQHIGPHDLENRDWGDNAQTRKKQALDLGIKFEVVPRIEVKADSIEAARRLIGVSFFDSVHCTLLVERLENYRKRWNKALGVFSADAVHDAASHPADAYQQGAMFQKPDRLAAADRGRPRPEPRRGSPWSA